jgi:hypothetical protein
MQIRYCPAAETRVALGNDYAGRAALPNAHQPNRIETITGDAVPCRGGDRAQVQKAAGFSGQLEQPCTSIYLVYRWIAWPGRYQAAPLRGSATVKNILRGRIAKISKCLAIHSRSKAPATIDSNRSRCDFASAPVLRMSDLTQFGAMITKEKTESAMRIAW